MSRPPKGERSNTKGRPTRRAASKTHYFKYQLANNPSRAEEKDLKLALQQSLEEHQPLQPPKRQPKNRPSPKETNSNSDHNIRKRTGNNSNNGLKTYTSSSTDSSDLSRSNNSSYSNESAGFVVINALKQMKRTRAGSSMSSSRTSPANKKAKLNNSSTPQRTNGHVSKNTNHSSASSVSSQPKTAFITTIDIGSSSSSSCSSNTPSPIPPPKAIRTYSRCQPEMRNNNQDNSAKHKQPPVICSSTPIQKVSSNDKGKTQQRASPQNCQINGLKGSSCNKTVSKSTQTDLEETTDLSKKKINQNQATNVKLTKRRLPQGSWSLLGAPEEKTIYLRDDEPPRRMICYPAIKHVEGDVIQVRDSVLLRSGARKTDLPYIAKVCSLWQDAETGNVMMSLFWYYRPEHTEDGRKPHHLPDEIFASRHRDVDSVECIEDRCYVLTFNEYCRYKKRCKMEQVNATWSLTDVTIPVSNESYPRRNRIPSSDVNPELVFCCRQIYDSRMRRLIKNPLINSKYGHI